MRNRNARLSSISIAALSLLALLAACGDDGGGSGGGGSGASTTSGTTTSNGTTSSTGSSAGGCTELCTTLNKCSGVTPSDCAADCPPVEMLLTASGCADEYSTFVGCVLALTDPCTSLTVGGDCSAENATLVMCTTDYCSANPGAAGCS